MLHRKPIDIRSPAANRRRQIARARTASAAQQILNHLSVHHRQHGMDFPDRLVGNPIPIEIIVAQHYDVAELILFDRA
jgi:hypothetical protein